MESGRLGLLDKLKAEIWKILKKEQEESKKKQRKTENQESLKQKSWTDELRDLAPIDNVENFDTYEQTLNWAFQNERVKNIALSGPYGSGKSSVIETYLRRNEKVKESTLKVSLATFTSGVKRNQNQEEQNQKETNPKGLSEETQNGEDSEMKIGINEDEIEKAILKQLFYKVKPNRIPLSRFRKLRPQSWTDRVKAFAVISFLIILTLMLMYGKEASNRKQEIDRQHYTIPNQRPKDKHCGKI